jgi:hypothetical protein
MLGKVLAKRAAADPAFAHELLALIDEANAAGASEIVAQRVGDVSGGEVNMAGRDIYQAGYVRGPEGIIVELAEQIG